MFRVKTSLPKKRAINFRAAMRKKLNYFILIFSISIIFGQTEYPVEHFLEGIAVSDIAGSPDDLWIATGNDGVYSFSERNGKWNHYSTANRAVDQDFFYSIDLNDNFVWAGSADGLFTFNKRRKNWQKRKFGKGGQLGNWIRVIKFDESDDCVWIGRFQFLTKLDLSTRRFTDYDLTEKKDTKTNSFRAIEIDGKNTIWFGTEGGLHKFNKRRDLNDKSSTQFYDNSLNYFKGGGDKISVSALSSTKNFLWIGLDEFKTAENPNFNFGGLYKFDRNFTWERIDNFDGLAGNGINCLEKTGNYLWVAVYSFVDNGSKKQGKGLGILNLGTGKFKMLGNSGIPSNINKIHFDGNNIWLGADDGLYRINMRNKFADFK